MGRKLYLLESRKLIDGDIFEFGVWEGKPIEWQVLANRGGILCISKYCLEKRRFDLKSNVWKNSELRQWLNTDFYNKAFDSEEKSFMLPYEGDKVTLLSIEEVERYFSSEHRRRATDLNGTSQWWWLRSRGCDSDYGVNDAAGVFTDGSVVNFGGYGVRDASHSVRPVIFLKKDVEHYLDPEI